MSDSSSLPDICPLCIRRLQSDDDVVEDRQKGADSINAANIQRDDNVVVELSHAHEWPVHIGHVTSPTYTYLFTY